MAAEYTARIDQERSAYNDCINVHDLPQIALYWHTQHLLPKFQHFGLTQPIDVFDLEIRKRCAGSGQVNHIVSIGSGNCDLEVQLAAALQQGGVGNFVIDCLDLNAAMLERGAAMARERGVADKIRPQQGDFNRWRPEREYDIVMANQALHHVLELEHLFGAVHSCLKFDGVFLVSDMIGRNGHMRWPEALEIVHEFWRELPPRYRYNHQLRRHEELYDNWDCSTEGFEGIRAQDILPLLVERFHFEMFLAFGNVIDPFVDRAFGHNFSPDAEWDRNFIDRVHQRDEVEMAAGRIKPTHMLAVLTKSRTETKILGSMTPEFAVRRTH